MKKEYLLAIYTILCWGTLPTVTKLTLTSISNMQVLFISSLIAAICLLMYLLVSGKIRLFKAIDKSDLLRLIGLGFLGNFYIPPFTMPVSALCLRQMRVLSIIYGPL